MTMYAAHNGLQEEIDAMYAAQFSAWPEVKCNYDKLLSTRRKGLDMGDLPVIVQCNPERGRSTKADVSATAVAARPCFLCKKNRPKEQLAGESIPDFEILINPYPILPVHFTIASKEHAPQSAMPLEMVDFVNMAPELVAFYNGAKAGASAPDHLHFQAVRISELPLLKIVSERHSLSEGYVRTSGELGSFPMSFLSFVVTPDMEGMALLALLPKLGGVADNEEDIPGLVNTFIWKDASGILRALVIPRRRHRPDCYFEEGEKKLLVSPGALDMAGLIVCPREEDFEKINAEDVREIYAQTGISKEELAEYLKHPMLKLFREVRR